ncbi:uncharacterized protein TNCV_4942211 [Trichonephila clavipes]|nr:uncharacterized protein TNCV_4942211 [Trichonephila clavipes]
MRTTRPTTIGASTSAAGAVEIMQMDDEIASILTLDCVSIDCAGWSFMKTHWAATSARFTSTLVNNPFEHKIVMSDRSAPEKEALLARQNLATSKTWMEDSMPVNVPGFDMGSSYNTAKRRQIATSSSVAVSSSSSRKAGGVAIYRNINSVTDCNRVNIDISEISLGRKEAKAGDVCLVNEKVNVIFKFILGCVCIHSGTALTEIKLFMLRLLKLYLITILILLHQL